MPEKMGWDSARVVVWYDNASGNLCFANRAGLNPGEEIPYEKIYRIPVGISAEFFDAVMNTALGESFREDAEDYDKIMYGVQKLLDSRVIRAIEVAEGFRLARSKAAGGGTINSLTGDVVVHGDLHAKLLALREQVNEIAKDWKDEHPFQDNPASVIGNLLRWAEQRGLLED